MTTTHTPGPWTFDSTATGATVYQEMAGTIATIPADLLAYRANTRLIAAAPDLLDALRDAADLIESLGLDCAQARKAIARATGEV